MKRYLFFAFMLATASTTYAQEELHTAADAMRFSTDNMNGTARFRGMSGAMGAVGGDLSAMTVNPAGAAVFNYNTGTGSLTSYNISNTTSYFGTRRRETDSALELNQLGAVFVFNNMNEGAFMNRFTLGFNYENTNNLDNSFDIHGVNPNTSIDQYFLRFANGVGAEGGITLDALNNSFFEDLNFIDQQAYLGYNAYLFNPVVDTPSNTEYVSNVPTAGNFYQENYINTRGYNGKVALNFAAQLKNRLYVGANLNVHFTDYIKSTSFYEEYGSDGADDLNAVRFNNERYTYGGGFSLNVGAILKVTEEFRAGVAYESPTWYRLQDELRQSIVSNMGGETFVTDPGIAFVYDDYSLQTPSKWTGSLAYVFGKSGLISVDGSLKNYSQTKFTGDGAGYGTINSDLRNSLRTAAELRVGAEYRIKNFSLRGGYRFEQSPYENETTIGDLWGFSGGLGFSFANSRLDLAYNYFQREMDIEQLSGFINSARAKSNNNNITLSYTIDL